MEQRINRILEKMAEVTFIKQNYVEAEVKSILNSADSC
jgi:hypothetical protein